MLRWAVLPPQLLNITDGFMSLMFENGDLREDLRLPEGDLGKEIQSKFENSDDFLVSCCAAFRQGRVPSVSTRSTTELDQKVCLSG